MLGKLEVYAILEKVATDQTEFFLFYTKEGAKHLDTVLEGAKHNHFSQFSCEKRVCFIPSKARPGFFGWYDFYY